MPTGSRAFRDKTRPPGQRELAPSDLSIRADVLRYSEAKEEVRRKATSVSSAGATA